MNFVHFFFPYSRVNILIFSYAFLSVLLHSSSSVTEMIFGISTSSHTVICSQSSTFSSTLSFQFYNHKLPLISLMLSCGGGGRFDSYWTEHQVILKARRGDCGKQEKLMKHMVVVLTLYSKYLVWQTCSSDHRADNFESHHTTPTAPPGDQGLGKADPAWQT